MAEFVPPAGYEIMSPQAQERVRRNRAAHAQNAEVIRKIGPLALGPGDGLIDPVAWDGKPIPGRKWIVSGLIPSNTVTLLTGNGGEGKSLLALQLLKCARTGTAWLGRGVQQVRAMGIFCEDDEDELMRRSEGVLTPDGLHFYDLDGLTFFDRDGLDSLLYEAQFNDPIGRTTAFFERVWETVRADGAELLVLDSLYNFFGGNENVRGQVNHFIGELKRLGRKLGCAIVLVGHPSRAGMGPGGDGTAGNTAWHNSVRSRLYLHRKKHPSGDPEKKGPLVLEHMKANYGQALDVIEVEYDSGRFVVAGEGSQPKPDKVLWKKDDGQGEFGLDG